MEVEVMEMEMDCMSAGVLLLALQPAGGSWLFALVVLGSLLLET